MKSTNKKLNTALNYAGKATLFLVMTVVLFAPFSQLGTVPVAHAVTKAECDARNGEFSLDSNGGGVCGTKGANITTGISKSQGANDFGCSFISGEGVGKDLALCVSSLVYYIGPGLASNVAYVAAYFFSYTVSLSLNSVAYALDFLSSGWTTVRDLANMAFILILVYIAFMIMFQAETTGTIRTLAWVIFIALIINFSFFLTRVVIDAGNILSVQFYNAIPQTATLNGTAGLGAFGGSGVKDLSASVMDAVGLQTLFSTASFNEAQKSAGNSVMGGLIVLTLVFLSVAVMFWILFFVFLQVGIKFLFRIVVLWFIIISAPLALVAKAVPQPSVKKYYDMWQNYLIKFSFYPAIFLFIYLIMVKFIQQMLMGQSGNLVSTLFSGQTVQSGAAAAGQVVNLSLAGAIATVSIRMGFIVAMFYVALKASDWIVTEGSNAAANITSRLTGAALGTAAFAGRMGIGGLVGGAIVNRPGLANGGVLARGLWNSGRFLTNRTFDARNVPGVKRGLGTLGGDLVKGRTLDVGKGHTQTAQTMEKKVEAFNSWLTDGPSDASKKARQELNDRVKEVGLRTKAKELGKLNGQWAPIQKQIDDIKKEQKPIKEEIEGMEADFNAILKRNPGKKRLDELENTHGPLTTAQIAERDNLKIYVDSLRSNFESRKAPLQAEYDRHETAKKPLEAQQDELRPKREPLIKGVEGMSNSQIVNLSVADIGAVIQQVSESQLKAIKESQKYTGQAIKELTQKWHEENKKAPMVKSKEELDKLDKIHEELQKVGVNIKSVKERGMQASGDIVVNTKAAKDLKEAFEEEKDTQEAKKQGASGDDRKQIQMAINQLNKALKKVDTVVENLEKVPEEIGGSKVPGEFIIKKP